MENDENHSPNIRGRGIPISPQLRLNVIKLNNEMESAGVKRKVIQKKVEEIHNITKSSFYRIIKNREKLIPTIPRRKSKFNITEEDIKKIDAIIEKNYEKFTPTRIDLFKKMKDEIEDQLISFKRCSRATFYRLLRRAGYKDRLTSKVARMLKIQELSIKKQRKHYLLFKKELEKQFQFIYLDETYIHKNYMKTKLLLPLKNSKRIRLKLQIAKGKRFSVLYAGGFDGFVEGSLLVAENSELNSDKFENWMQNQLIANLTEPRDD